MAKRLATPFRLMHHSINTEYRNYDKIAEKHRVGDREELRKLMKAICKVIGEQIVERPGGVHIHRLGYFFVWKIPRKTTFHMKVRGEGLKESYNYHSNHHMFSPIFIPSVDSRKTLEGWSMDNSFTSVVKQGIKDKVRANFIYRAYPYSIKTLNRI